MKPFLLTSSLFLLLPLNSSFAQSNKPPPSSLRAPPIRTTPVDASKALHSELDQLKSIVAKQEQQIEYLKGRYP